MKVSAQDARRWLKQWGYTFSLELKEIVGPHLDDLFAKATLRDYPNQPFTRFYFKVNSVITEAGDLYAEKIGLENVGDSYSEADRCRLVRCLMVDQPGQREGITYVDFRFAPPETTERDGPETSFRVHVIAHGRKVTARVLEDKEPTPRGVKVFGKAEPPSTVAPSQASSSHVSQTVQ